MVIWPSHMNIMSQKCECRIFRCFFTDQLNFCGTNWKVWCDEVNCHYWKLNSILFHWGQGDSAQGHLPVEFPHTFLSGHQMAGMGSSSQLIFESLVKSPPYASYVWRLVASGQSPEWTACHIESNGISPSLRLLLSTPSPGFGNSFHFQSRPLDANMTGLESCRMTAPRPFLDASVLQSGGTFWIEIWKCDILGNFLFCPWKSNTYRFS